MRILHATFVAAALALAPCSTASATQRDATPALEGSWGGRHIALNVGTLDTGVEFDCAEGTFYGPYFVGKNGRFSWPGTFTRGTGGPTQIDSKAAELSATYVGVFRGGDMTLSVKLENGQTIGPFTLERFKEPQLTRCL